jgi:arylsulfatase A-like enzyme
VIVTFFCHVKHIATRATIALCCGSLCLAAVQTASADDSGLSTRPNIILIMTDDQGYGDLGCHGNTMIRTPNLDALHAESLRLTDFHVDPTCSPTRAALLTGRYSTRTGVWHTVMGRSLMYRDEVTLADIAAQNGYRTAIFGKWHLGDNFPFRPEDRGFQEVVIHGGGGIGQTPDYWGNQYVDDHFIANGTWKPFEGYCTDVFFDEALKFIEQNRTRPFFTYIPTNVPHSPFIAPDDLDEAYRDRGVPEPMASFYGMIENCDANVGRLLAKLKEWDLEENTILIFMTDNGTAAGVARPGNSRDADDRMTWTGFNAGMRAQKGSPYDGGHRVPCFIRWPAGGLTGGRDVTALTAHIDILPTLVELANLEFTPPQPLDGESLVTRLRDGSKEGPQRTLFVHTQREERPPKWVQSAVMTSRWRLMHGRELYDIQADPGQVNDIAVHHPEVVAKLREEYESWWKSLEPAISRHARIVIGAPEAELVHINCMDWHAPLAQIPWNQPMIDRLPEANGFWMLEVARRGRYEFTLRHKPAQAEFPIQAQQARVEINDLVHTEPVFADGDHVRMEITLPAGPARLQTWLEALDGSHSRGAFFLDVRYLGDSFNP